MDTRVKLIFDRNPKQEEVYQIIGSNRYFKEKKNALEAVFGNENDLQTHKRADYEKQETGKNIIDVLSEVSGLSKDELNKTAQAVIDKKKAATAKTKTPASSKVEIPEGEPTKGWKVPEIKAYMKLHKIPFTQKDNEDQLLEKVANHKPAK
jgi:propanediol utilization protein